MYFPASIVSYPAFSVADRQAQRQSVRSVRRLRRQARGTCVQQKPSVRHISSGFQVVVVLRSQTLTVWVSATGWNVDELRRPLSVRPWLCGNVPVRIAARDGEHSGSAATAHVRVSQPASQARSGSERRTGEVVVREQRALGADTRVKVVHVGHPDGGVVAVEQRILVVLRHEKRTNVVSCCCCGRRQIARGGRQRQARSRTVSTNRMLGLEAAPAIAADVSRARPGNSGSMAGHAVMWKARCWIGCWTRDLYRGCNV